MKQRKIHGRSKAEPKPTNEPKASKLQTTCIGCVYMAHPYIDGSGNIDIKFIYCSLYDKRYNGKGCQQFQSPSAEWNERDNELRRRHAARLIHASNYSRDMPSGDDQINELLRGGVIPQSMADYLLQPASSADLDFLEDDRRRSAGVNREPGNCNECAHCNGRTTSMVSGQREVVHCGLFGDVPNQRCSCYV